MVVATGFFDGVHKGHRIVIDKLVSAAHERGTESLVITFWPHPRNVLQNDARGLRLLSSLQEKKEMLLSLGVDRVEVLDFTKEFSRLSTEEYIWQYLIGRYDADAVVLGYDNRMGCDSGTTDEIASMASGMGLEVIMADALDVDDVTVSSTKIREALQCGDVTRAGNMLGYDYFLTGVVVEGNRLGRTIGFPTANMQMYDPLKMVPCNGVYLTAVKALGRSMYGMTNIGTRPTVTGVVSSGSIPNSMRTIETNIFDFDEEIYGLDISVSFLARIREERRFDSLDALARQLENDRLQCRSLI